MTEAALASSAVEISTPAGVVDAQLFHPDVPGAWPGVVLLTDIRGVRPAFAEMGRELAARGYSVLLPNLYYRAGRAAEIAAALASGDEAAKARRSALRAALTPEAWRSDLAALFGFLVAQPQVRGGKFGIIGYCMSGALALRSAADFPEQIAAAASFHGGGLASDTADSPHLRAGAVKAELYFGHAEADASMPEAAIARLDAALRAVGLNFTSEVYEGARHGFAVADGQAYHPQAAARHWRSVHALLERALAVPAAV